MAGIPVRSWETIRTIKYPNANNLVVVYDTTDTNPFFYVRSAAPGIPTSVLPPQTGAASASNYTDTALGINIAALLDANTGLMKKSAMAGGSSVPLVGVVSTTNGAVGQWTNPETTSVWVKRIVIQYTHISTGAASMAVSTATTATGVAVATFIASLDINGVAAPFVTDNLVNMATSFQGTSQVAGAVVAPGNFVSFKGSADTSGFVGTAFIDYVSLPV